MVPVAWLMSILEDAGFRVRSGSGTDLAIKASVNMVGFYVDANILEEMVNYSMMFQKLLCPDYSEEEVQKLKRLLMDKISRLKSYSEAGGSQKSKMIAWLSVAWRRIKREIVYTVFSWLLILLILMSRVQLRHAYAG